MPLTQALPHLQNSWARFSESKEYKEINTLINTSINPAIILSCPCTLHLVHYLGTKSYCIFTFIVLFSPVFSLIISIYTDLAKFATRSNWTFTCTQLGRVLLVKRVLLWRKRKKNQKNIILEKRMCLKIKIMMSVRKRTFLTKK